MSCQSEYLSEQEHLSEKGCNNKISQIPKSLYTRDYFAYNSLFYNLNTLLYAANANAISIVVPNVLILNSTNRLFLYLNSQTTNSDYYPQPINGAAYLNVTGVIPAITGMTAVTKYENLALAYAFCQQYRSYNNYRTYIRPDRHGVRFYGWYINLQTPNLQLLTPIPERNLGTKSEDSYATIIPLALLNTATPTILCKYKFLKDLFKLSANAICKLYDDADVAGEVVVYNDSPLDESNPFTRFYIYDKTNTPWILSIAPCSNNRIGNANTDEYVIVGAQLNGGGCPWIPSCS